MLNVTDRQIAARLGVAHTTVMRTRDKMEKCGAMHHVEKTVDTLGREQPRHSGNLYPFIIPQNTKPGVKQKVINILVNTRQRKLPKPLTLGNLLLIRRKAFPV